MVADMVAGMVADMVADKKNEGKKGADIELDMVDPRDGQSHLDHFPTYGALSQIWSLKSINGCFGLLTYRDSGF